MAHASAKKTSSKYNISSSKGVYGAQSKAYRGGTKKAPYHKESTYARLVRYFNVG